MDVFIHTVYATKFLKQTSNLESGLKFLIGSLVSINLSSVLKLGKADLNLMKKGGTI